jgi:hypothetical protein
MKLAKQNASIEPFSTVSEMRRATEPSYGPRPSFPVLCHENICLRDSQTQAAADEITEQFASNSGVV